jgi:hypothetical protein
MTLPEILECAHLGPNDRLVIRVSGDWTDDQLQDAALAVKGVGLDGRVLIVANAEEMIVVDV